MRSWRRTATKVVIFQWPRGTLATNRFPHGQRPRNLVMLVEVPVSSMKTMDQASAALPVRACLADVFAVLFGSVQAFFEVRSWRSQNRHTELALTLIPRCAAGHGFLPVSGPV
jgi:hypothetical protein